jgi:hypothetical protein
MITPVGLLYGGERERKSLRVGWVARHLLQASLETRRVLTLSRPFLRCPPAVVLVLFVAPKVYELRKDEIDSAVGSGRAAVDQHLGQAKAKAS